LDIGCGSGCGFWKLWNIGCGCECGWQHPFPHPTSKKKWMPATGCELSLNIFFQDSINLIFKVTLHFVVLYDSFQDQL
jgi:hypothetical protein